MINKIRENETTETIKGLVSVVIPTYNRASTLERAILSVICQTYKEWELILIDDGSTDDTEVLISKFISEKIHYIKFETNQGVCRARNLGIKHAKGEYIAFLDSDDEWVADKLEKQLKEMQQKGTKVVYCRFSRQCEEDIYVIPSETQIEHLEGDLFYELLLESFIGTPTVVIAKDVLEEIGGFNENLKSMEDYELILRIARDFYIAFVDEILVHTYAQKGSLNTNIYNIFFTKKYLLELYHEEYQCMGVYEIALAKVLEFGKLAKKMKANELIQKLEKENECNNVEKLR